MGIQSFIHDKAFELDTLQIYSSSGKIVDVYSSMLELNIFEDIYTPSMSGELVINDSNDLPSALPMLGFEFLRIVFTKPGNNPIEKVFRIYKIDGVETNFSNQANQNYIVKFCSEESILSLGSVISKSYKGKSVKDIVSDILTGYLKVNKTKLSQELLQSTAGTYDIIVPFMKPFEAINWVVSRSNPPCIFYENKKGYNLKRISSLFTQNPVAFYSYAPQNADLVGPDGLYKNRNDGEEIKVDIFNMIGFKFYSLFDVMDGLRRGMFASSLGTIDVVRQKSENYLFEYNDYFNKTKHIDSNRKSYGAFENNFEDRTKRTISQMYPAVRKLYPTNKDHNTDLNIAQFQPNIKQNLVEEWMLQRMSQMQQLEYFRVKFLAPGNATINAGDVIDFAMPRIISKDGTITNYEHPYHSGRYLITSIRHKINLTSYEMIMEGVKDCVSSRYPDALSSDANIDKAKSI